MPAGDAPPRHTQLSGAVIVIAPEQRQIPAPWLQCPDLTILFTGKQSNLETFRMQMRTFVATLVSAVLLSCGSAFASAHTLVIPNGLETTPGNASEGLSGPASFEYQEDFGR